MLLDSRLSMNNSGVGKNTVMSSVLGIGSGGRLDGIRGIWFRQEQMCF